MTSIVSQLISLATADYWDCNHRPPNGNLTHQAPELAVERYLEDQLKVSPVGLLDPERIMALGSVEVWPWHRARVGDAEADSLVDRAFDYLEDVLQHDEEFGDPDGEHSIISDEAREKHRPAFIAAMRALSKDIFPWRCNRGIAVVLSPEEVVALMQEHFPHRFSPKEQK